LWWAFGIFFLSFVFSRAVQYKYYNLNQIKNEINFFKKWFDLFFNKFLNFTNEKANAYNKKLIKILKSKLPIDSLIRDLISDYQFVLYRLNDMYFIANRKLFLRKIEDIKPLKVIIQDKIYYTIKYIKKKIKR
jgi:hypothetical protein